MKRLPALAMGLMMGVAGWAADFAVPLEQEVPVYRIGSWGVDGRGHHRAVIRVEEPAPAVLTRVPWRRRDPAPENKKIVVFAPGGEAVAARPLELSAAYGDVVFAAPEAGEYHLYYLPFVQGKNWSDHPGEYFTPDYPEWEFGDPARLPRAEVVALEAIDDFNRFDPMEIPALPGEQEGLRRLADNAPFLVFPEDRLHPVKMFDVVPVRWLERGPGTSFEGTAQPGEYYVFQLAVWNCSEAAVELDCRTGELSGAMAAIGTGAIECVNLDIVDFHGRRSHRPIAVEPGRVQPLWFVVRVPAELPAGDYRGTFELSGAGRTTPVTVGLTVAGEVLPDGGVGDNWRLARLAWLNSTLGWDDTVPAPYTPIERDGATWRVLGREIRFGADGLPESIRSNGRELLAGPMRCVAVAGGREVLFDPGAAEATAVGDDRSERVVSAAGAAGALAGELRTALESDGMLACEWRLTARSAVTLDDVTLLLPVRSEAAPYWMGLGERGGRRHGGIQWKWDAKRAANYFWLGDAGGGIQLHLPGDGPFFEPMSVTPSTEWHNGGAGGIDVSEEGDAVLVRAYSGARRLEANESVVFRFRLLVTPFHPQSPERWQWRFKGWGAGAGNIGSIFHAERGNPYINYPFAELDNLAEEVEKIRTLVPGGGLQYPAAGRTGADSGSMEVEFKLNFDPAAVTDETMRSVIELFWPDNYSSFGLFLGPEGRLRLHVIVNQPERGLTSIPFIWWSEPLPPWREGEVHRLGVSWQEGEASIWADGKLFASTPLDLGQYWNTEQMERAVFSLHGGLWVGAVRASKEAMRENPGPLTASGEFFDPVGSAGELRPRGVAGSLVGNWSFADGWLRLDGSGAAAGREATLYDTAREMSVHAPELWALRSLPDPIFGRVNYLYAVTGGQMIEAGGGDPWLREHLIDGYAPAWRTPTYSGEMDMAVGMLAPTRWHNFYLAGVDYLSRRFPINGIYLDAFGGGREVAKRLRKILLRNLPETGHLWWHGGNNYDYLENHSSIFSTQMDSMAFFSQAWSGEGVDFSRGKDYYLIELSAIPFGPGAEMLEPGKGGNPWRGMIYGMSGRDHRSAAAMYGLWDDFGIGSAAMLGYWDEACPVRTDNPEIPATVYLRHGEAALIALAHWPDDSLRGNRRASAGYRAGGIAADGYLGDPGWREALVLDDFSIHQSLTAPRTPTEVRMAWDEQYLYLGFLAGGQSPGNLVAAAAERDGTLWDDDSVEIYLRPDLNDSRYYQLIGNSRGVLFDSRDADAAWNGAIDYRTQIRNDGWSGEFRIPWTALECAPPRPGQPIGFNACRNRILPVRENSCWSPVSGSYHAVSAFGTVTLDRAPRAAERLRRNADGTASCRLEIDYAAMGFEPGQVRAVFPEITAFQEGGEADLAAPVSMGAEKGALILLERK